MLTKIALSDSDNENTHQSRIQQSKVYKIPDQLADSLNHIVRQIDVLTQTMSILESRLTINEDRLTELIKKVE